ncbi:MAG: type II toxin-antitoxin system RelE/ParE family toxin [Pyrinomonadaceae bacterium]
MWRIEEHRGINKICRKMPSQVLKKYELWKQIVYIHGPDKLREFPGFHDEKLEGQLSGQRSSRLSLQYRVIYRIDRDVIRVQVLRITPHEY